MLAAMAAGTAFYIGLALGGVGALVSTTIAIKWQSGRIAELKLQNERYESAAIVGRQLSERDARLSQERIDDLGRALEKSRLELRESQIATLKDIERLTDPDRVSLSPRTVGLLNRRAGSDTSPKDTGPSPVPGFTSPSAADRGGYFGASERTVAKWVAFALKTDAELRETVMFLSGAIKAAPQCFEIVD